MKIKNIFRNIFVKLQKTFFLFLVSEKDMTSMRMNEKKLLRIEYLVSVLGDSLTIILCYIHFLLFHSPFLFQWQSEVSKSVSSVNNAVIKQFSTQSNIFNIWLFFCFFTQLICLTCTQSSPAFVDFFIFSTAYFLFDFFPSSIDVIKWTEKIKSTASSPPFPFVLFSVSHWLSASICLLSYSYS